MDLFRLIDFCQDTADFVNNTLKDINDKISNINDKIQGLEDTINNSEKHSPQYISQQIKKRVDDLNDSVDSLKAGIKKRISDINDNYEKKATQIKKDLVTAAQTQLGLSLPNALIEKLASAIPTPALPIPEFDITIPELNFQTTDKMSFQRIPLIPIPGAIEETKEKLDSIEKQAEQYKANKN